MKSISMLIAGLALCAGLAAPEVAWSQFGHAGTFLGEKHVSDRGDRDTFRVGGRRGAFTGLRVEVSGSAVQFKRVVVRFESGGEQVFEKDHLLLRNTGSGIIDLRGGPRQIEKVVFHYEARSPGWQGAEVRLYGVRR